MSEKNSKSTRVMVEKSANIPTMESVPNSDIGTNSANTPTMESISGGGKDTASANIPTMETVTKPSGGSSGDSGSKK